MCDPVVRHRSERAGGSLRDKQNNQLEAHEQNAHGSPSDGYAAQNAHGLYPRKDSKIYIGRGMEAGFSRTNPTQKERRERSNSRYRKKRSFATLRTR
jgi:hypothetical protein